MNYKPSDGISDSSSKPRIATARFCSWSLRKTRAMETLLKHEDLLNLCDRIINGWRKHLSQDAEGPHAE
jgi:hypothetical protein